MPRLPASTIYPVLKRLPSAVNADMPSNTTTGVPETPTERYADSVVSSDAAPSIPQSVRTASAGGSPVATGTKREPEEDGLPPPVNRGAQAWTTHQHRLCKGSNYRRLVQRTLGDDVDDGEEDGAGSQPGWRPAGKYRPDDDSDDDDDVESLVSIASEDGVKAMRGDARPLADE